MGYSANASIAFGWYPDLDNYELDMALGLATEDDEYYDSRFHERCDDEEWEESLGLDINYYGDMRADDNKLYLYVAESELRGDEWAPVAVSMSSMAAAQAWEWRLKIIDFLKSRFNYTPKAEEIGWRMTVFYG